VDDAVVDGSEARAAWFLSDGVSTPEKSAEYAAVPFSFPEAAAADLLAGAGRSALSHKAEAAATRARKTRRTTTRWVV